jgi:DNA polymerase-3 subunit epsilon
MLPMLEARGFATLGEVLQETRRYGRLLQDLNA